MVGRGSYYRTGIGETRWPSCALRFFWQVAVLVFLVMPGACTKNEVVKTLPPAPDAVLFSNAERLFDQKLYGQALAEYQSYLMQYPRKPMADAALMKMGMIYQMQGNTFKEKVCFEQLLRDYPNSPFLPDVRRALFFTHIREKNYQAAIEQGNILLKDSSLSGVHYIRINESLGDCYGAVHRPVEAVIAYARAHERAEREEQAALWKRLTTAIEKVSPQDLKMLLAVPPEGPFGGTLFFLVGKGLVEAKRLDEAIAVLSRMIEQFPMHARISESRSLLESLQRKPTKEQCVIGCLLPLSGSLKFYGEQAQRGIELALSQIGEQKGEVPFQVIIKDSTSDPDKAAAVVREFCDGRVSALIGPITIAGPAAEAAQKCGTPIITLTGKEGIPEIGDYVFRNFITPQMQVASLVTYVTNILKLKRFAVLYPDEKYGVTLMNLFWDKVIDNGGRIYGAESYKPDANDFSLPIEKLIGIHYDMPQDFKTGQSLGMSGGGIGGGTNPPSSVSPSDKGASEKGGAGNREKRAVNEPAVLNDESGVSQKVIKKKSGTVDFDALFIPDAPGKVGQILPQLSFYDVDKVILLGTNLWHSNEWVQKSGEYLENVIVPDGFFAESDLPHVKAFVQAFQAAYKTTPGFIEAVAFDTAMMLFNLLDQQKPLSGKAMRDAIASIRNYNGVTGRTTFLHNRDVTKELFLLEVVGNRFQALQPLY